MDGFGFFSLRVAKMQLSLRHYRHNGIFNFFLYYPRIYYYPVTTVSRLQITRVDANTHFRSVPLPLDVRARRG